MGKAKKIVYDTRRKLNATYSGTMQTIPLVDYIGAINWAQEVWFENMLSIAEIDPQVRDDLKVFEVKRAILPVSSLDGKVDKAKLPEDYYRRLNLYAEVCNEECCPGITKDVIIRINKSDDINETNQNPFRRADFAYEQLNGDEAGDDIYIYHLGEMDVKKVYMDYYRKPKEIHAPTLILCAAENGVYYDYNGDRIEEDCDFEVSDRFADQKISSLAALFLSGEQEDYQKFQIKLNQIMATPSLFKS